MRDVSKREAVYRHFGRAERDAEMKRKRRCIAESLGDGTVFKERGNDHAWIKTDTTVTLRA